MKSKVTWILLLLSVLTFQFSFAQTKIVSGVVTSKDYGDPIPGATVMVEGTTRGVDTDENGKYSINAAQGDKLIVQYLGFVTYKATVGTSSVLNIALVEEESEELIGIVIDTYRTVAKPKSNVAASTVTSETIEGRPNASFVQTLQAQVPGLNIATGSGQPGSNNTTVILRGIGSINGNVEPLFVIDGVPMGSDNFRSINPNDIENISVLKDAGATSIYGNRGANGVIVVTTKGGSFDQDLSIKYVGSSGVSVLQKNKYDMMTGSEMRAFEREAFQLTGGDLGNNWSNAAIRNSPNQNWLDHFFRPAISQNHTLSLSSGSKNLSSFTSIGYADQEGVLQNTDLKRFNFRSNMNGKSKDNRLTYGTNLTANFSRSNLATNLGTGAVNQNYVLGGVQGLPYMTPADYPGSGAGMIDLYLVTPDDLKLTPLLLMDKMKYFKLKQEEFKFIAQGNINYKLTDSFTIGTSIGTDYTTINQSSYDNPASFNAIIFGSLSTGQEYNGDRGEIYERTFSVNSTSYLKWAESFGKHTLNAGVFLEYLKADFKSNSLTQNGLDPLFSGPGAGTGWIADNNSNDFYVPNISGSRLKSGLFSYFGTVDYDFDSKYGVGVTVRRDASYRFAQSNRWGTFYSVSARWNISNENFMAESVINDLKLRGSYGTAGNQDVLGTGLFGASNLYSTLYGVGTGYNNSPSLIYTQLPNRGLKWETITQANIGVDFGIWSSRLRGTIDVYEKTTSDLYQSKPISAINGATTIAANVGSMRNRGVELLLAADIVKNDNFKFTLNVNGAYNKNELVDLPTDNGVVWSGGDVVLREGDIINQYYLVPYIGVNPANGNLLFMDKNGNPTEAPTNDDRRFTNKSQVPVYQGGFGFDTDYKGFFLTTQFSFALKAYRYDGDYSSFVDPSDLGLFNKSNDIKDVWTPNNQNASMPSLTANNRFYDSFSDRFIKDASYVRLRYVTLGYNFPAKNLAPLKLSSLRIYAQAENLYTWTKWKGFDAESNRISDYSNYPTPKTISFGIEVQF